MILGERFYQMTNAIFRYDLTPTEFMVYNYLVSCAGQKDMCWPSIRKIAVNCNCSENTARKAVASLTEKHFIRKTATYEDWQSGRSRQTNNTYYILDLPPVRNTAQSAPARTYRQVENTGPPQSPHRDAKCHDVCGSKPQHGPWTRQTPPTRHRPFSPLFRPRRGRKTRSRINTRHLNRCCSSHICPQCGQFRENESDIFSGGKAAT